MENIVSPKFETYNGEIVHNIKEELKKEIHKETIIKIESYFYYIHRILDNFLDNTLYQADYYCSYGGNNCAIDYINKEIQKAQISSTGVQKKYIDYINEYSPIEMMYFRICQYEYIGQIKDIIFINSIKFDITNIPSLDMIEEMKELARRNVQIEDIENIIIDEAPKIAKHVFLRDNITQNDIKKIRRQKNKVEQMFQFLYRATPYKPVDDLINKLHIVSFLQAIILDEKNEIFDYTFYGYQRFMKHRQHVQVSANTNKRPVDALKVYWNRKINDHWYANIGRYEVRCKLRELELIYDKTLLELLLNLYT